ncbi:hypothetical protein M5K25_006836 [Dendrobium thyrsiflorum]|uniref:RNase H type-1 domain-containing protein n=1 Tax=Dendrobium thyrsiflorum TaxID=117978 RepID=A0ABD0VJV3_DENTH
MWRIFKKGLHRSLRAQVGGASCIVMRFTNAGGIRTQRSMDGHALLLWLWRLPFWSLTRNRTFIHPEHWGTIPPIGLVASSSWCPPRPLPSSFLCPGWLKVNVDGALLQLNCRGIGLVLRDDVGEPLVAAGWGVKHWDSTQVELQAILYINGILEAWMFEKKGIIVEGDSAGIINFMQQYKN